MSKRKKKREQEIVAEAAPKVNKNKIIAIAFVVNLSVMCAIIFGVAWFMKKKDAPAPPASEAVKKETATSTKEVTKPHFGAEDLVLTKSLRQGSEERIEGVVTDKRSDFIQANSPAILDVKMKNGETVRIIYSPGSSECKNVINIDKINIGAKVEVFGKATSGGTIFTCESSEYFIKATGR